MKFCAIIAAAILAVEANILDDAKSLLKSIPYTSQEAYEKFTMDQIQEFSSTHELE